MQLGTKKVLVEPTEDSESYIFSFLQLARYHRTSDLSRLARTLEACETKLDSCICPQFAFAQTSLSPYHPQFIHGIPTFPSSLSIQFWGIRWLDCGIILSLRQRPIPILENLGSRWQPEEILLEALDRVRRDSCSTPTYISRHSLQLARPAAWATPLLWALDRSSASWPFQPHIYPAFLGIASQIVFYFNTRENSPQEQSTFCPVLTRGADQEACGIWSPRSVGIWLGTQYQNSGSLDQLGAHISEVWFLLFIFAVITRWPVLAGIHTSVWQGKLTE